jgi:hypothetical protein
LEHSSTSPPSQGERPIGRSSFPPVMVPPSMASSWSRLPAPSSFPSVRVPRPPRCRGSRALPRPPYLGWSQLTAVAQHRRAASCAGDAAPLYLRPRLAACHARLIERSTTVAPVPSKTSPAVSSGRSTPRPAPVWLTDGARSAHGARCQRLIGFWCAQSRVCVAFPSGFLEKD